MHHYSKISIFYINLPLISKNNLAKQKIKDTAYKNG